MANAGIALQLPAAKKGRKQHCKSTEVPEEQNVKAEMFQMIEMGFRRNVACSQLQSLCYGVTAAPHLGETINQQLVRLGSWITAGTIWPPLWPQADPWTVKELVVSVQPQFASGPDVALELRRHPASHFTSISWQRSCSHDRQRAHWMRAASRQLAASQGAQVQHRVLEMGYLWCHKMLKCPSLANRVLISHCYWCDATSLEFSLNKPGQNTLKRP